jgi:hypothetical protein
MSFFFSYLRDSGAFLDDLMSSRDLRALFNASVPTLKYKPCFSLDAPCRILLLGLQNDTVNGDGG